MLVGLFKTLCFILGIYFIGKVISRVFLPLFFHGVVKRAGDQVRQRQEEMLRQTQAQAQRKREGNVTVNYQPKSGKSVGKEEGDYIDFEEVK